jgi:hypothetical protein
LGDVLSTPSLLGSKSRRAGDSRRWCVLAAESPTPPPGPTINRDSAAYLEGGFPRRVRARSSAGRRASCWQCYSYYVPRTTTVCVCVPGLPRTPKSGDVRKNLSTPGHFGVWNSSQCAHLPAESLSLTWALGTARPQRGPGGEHASVSLARPGWLSVAVLGCW